MNAMPDPRPLFARAAEQLAALIKTVRPEQLAAPTPCSEFDVRTLLSHIVSVTRRIGVVGAGGDGLAVPRFAEGVPDDGWSVAYEEMRAGAIAAWADSARLDAQVQVPWGTVPGRAALSGFVLELVTHTWDLSEGLGRPLELDQELAEFALAFAQQALPADRRGEGVPFEAVLPAPEGADAYGQLAAWLGRRPLADR
ncbi:TIGR03086 family metal-binding protein [Streptomyces sp. NPDC002896]|uniref:TIGR03086 family metal-binding protein n=1 Tax=Streptomyces sp. NPDC002896 TaxID=3154438 RepID=UPI003323B6D7